MPDAIDTQEIVVTAPRIDRGLGFPWDLWFRSVYVELPTAHRFGPIIDNRHGVSVYWDGANPPSKAAVAQNVINKLSATMDRIGNIVDALSDDALIVISKTETITGAEMKARFSALKEIRVTEGPYRAGYGGINYGTSFEISWQTGAGWLTFGDGGENLLILHELAHNSISGDAVRLQNWNEHLSAGGTAATYIAGNQWFTRQEQMTNKLAMNMAAALKINIQQSGNMGPYPPGGVYTGSDL